MSDAPLVDSVDVARWRSMAERVEAVMADGRWRTLDELAGLVGAGSDAGLSARVRELRRRGWVVRCRKRAGAGRGIYEYSALAGGWR